MQKRTLKTRARLIAAAEAIIADVGFEELRVEEVVLRAGTAKGTFFAHFKDKETLLDLIIGSRIDTHLDVLQAMPAPRTAGEITEALMPLCELMTCERYVFDIILRYSGAAGAAEIGPIAATFGRQLEVFAQWLGDAPFRQDVSAGLLAEGIQAFLIQAMAAKFCALHNSQSIRERLEPYLRAWLKPGTDATGHA